jgi:hypothetical protein
MFHSEPADCVLLAWPGTAVVVSASRCHCARTPGKGLGAGSLCVRGEQSSMLPSVTGMNRRREMLRSAPPPHRMGPVVDVAVVPE